MTPTPTLTKEDRAKLRELIRAVPDEVWEYDEPSNWLGMRGRVFVRESYGLIAATEIEGWRPKSKAKARGELIASSRQALPRLLDEVERLELLVESAYKEGARIGIGYPIGGSSEESVFAEFWPKSDTRAALSPQTQKQALGGGGA